MGDPIALPLEEKEAKDVDAEQQLSLSPAWSDLNFTEVIHNVLEDKVEQATLEPAFGSARQREEVHSGSEMDFSPESVSGTSRRRTRSEAGDHENRETYKHSKLENFISQSSAGQNCKREDYEEKEKEEGGASTEWGDSMEEEGKEAIAESGEWTEVVSRRVKGGKGRRECGTNGKQKDEQGGEVG